MTECFTPNDMNGVCINIKRCPYLRNLLETQRKNNTVLAYLRNSACGYEGRDPKVCCPLEDEPIVPTTGVTSTNRPVTSNNNNNNNNNNGEDQVLSNKLPSQSTCGRTNTSHIRIVGGNPADLG